MKKQVRSLYIGALAMFLSVGIGLNAQNATPPAQPPDAQAQQPSTPDQATPPATKDEAQPTQAPSQTPNQPSDQTQTPSSAPTDSAQSTAVQSFTGTVVKSGDKYVLQDTDAGTTYDIDHQDEVAKFEGKRVKVKGTLDASGKMIHVQ